MAHVPPQPGGTRLDGLVAAARTGDSAAYEQLWRELSPPVLGYLRGRGTPEAEDILSEVFLAAFRGLSSFTGDGADFRAWLFTVAHHRGVDAVRRAQRDRRLEEYAPAGDPRRQRSAEEQALARLGDPVLAGALARLPEAQREVLVLRAVADLSLEEVARVTGRSVGAVKALQHRAVASMQRILRPAVSPATPPTIAPPR